MCSIELKMFIFRTEYLCAKNLFSWSLRVMTRRDEYFRFKKNRCNALQQAAIHGNTLQHTAIQCNTLQHTEIQCNTLTVFCAFQSDLYEWVTTKRSYTASKRENKVIVREHRCNTLQRTATHCNTLQYSAMHLKMCALSKISTMNDLWGGYSQQDRLNYRSLLQNIVSFLGLFCRCDLSFYRSYKPKPPHTTKRSCTARKRKDKVIVRNIDV